MRDRSPLLQPLPLVALVLLAGPALSQDLVVPRYPIVDADIVRELSSIGVGVGPSQIHLVAHITATLRSPKLKITTVDPLGSNQVRLEFHCSEPGECLPFIATVDVEDASSISAEIRSKTASTSADHQPKSFIGEGPGTRAKLAVGSYAVLIIRDGHMDIHLQVLAIDSGTVGQQVRVCTLDRKKIFHATITDEGIVTGAME